MLKKVGTFLVLCASWILYFTSYLFPRDKKTWIFIGWHKNNEREVFADNSKYLFLHVAQNYPNIKCIWIGADEKICALLQKKGYTAYSIHSLKGIWHSLRAGYTIIDAIIQIKNWRYSGGSKVVQLWHADGIKKLSFTHKWNWGDVKKIFLKPGHFLKYHFIISSSDYIRRNFVCPSFKVTEKSVVITGLPRYDIFFKDIKDANIDIHQELAWTLARIKKMNPEKLILYAPTFRRGKNLSAQLSPLNFSKLNHFLSQHNYYLIVSLHPKFSTSNWTPKEEYSNIAFSNPGYDQYPLLKEFDMLITDYSSICIEFTLLNKPVIFYTYDIEDYRKSEGLYEEFWSHMPGPRTVTYGELVSAISTPMKEVKNDVNKKRLELFEYTDSNSSERVVRSILLRD
jgi:CDP-glycerol glycerophosphotransferase (TagB/SpsB family)